MDHLVLDFRLALRRLRKSPDFTAVAVLILALGIGANATLFSVVNAMLLRPLPVERSDELVSLNSSLKGGIPTQSFPNYKDLRDRNDVLTGLAAYRFTAMSLGHEGSSSRVWGYLATGNYFEVLGVRAAVGRTFGPEDDRQPGAHPVAVLSYGCWQQRFGGDPNIVGRTVRVNGLSYNVLGVMPAGFFGTEVWFTPDLWVPMMMQPRIETTDLLERRETQNLFVVGRLKPGVGWLQAEAGLNSVAAELGRAHPDVNEGMRITLSPPGLAGNWLRQPAAGFSAVLLGVSGLVLLLACANVAGLLLARASDRGRETAIRLALGARRRQIVRHHLVESLVLAAIAGTVGLLIAMWTQDLLAVLLPRGDFPLEVAIPVDGHVLGFTAALALLTALLCGLAPSLQRQVDLLPALRNEKIAVFRRWQARDFLVAGQVALSVVLLAGSLLVVRSLQRALEVNLGFNPHGAVSLRVDLGLEGYDPERRREFQDRLYEGVADLPGFGSVALADSLPLLYLANSSSGVYVEGGMSVRAAEAPLAFNYAVSPGFLQTMQTRLLQGRDFAERDRLDTPLVSIVNQTFVSRLLPPGDPIGKRFLLEPSKEWIEIVGVVEDGKYLSLTEAPRPVAFRPLFQNYSSIVTVVGRSDLAAGEALAALQRAVAELDTAVSTLEPGPLTERLNAPLFPARAAAWALGVLGSLALLLAATGIYGSMAYAVSRCTREIGIRVALGASSGRVLRAVLGRIGLLLAVGTVIGETMALVFGRLFAPVLYGVNPRDPWTLGGAGLLMALAGLMACWRPVSRALSIGPAEALRHE